LKFILTTPEKTMDQQPAVIFDMDGVLVDSYRAHLRSWQMVGADVGVEITEPQFAATFGRTSREVIATWEIAQGFDEAKIAELDDRKETAFREILAADFPPMPGVHRLLTSLHEAGFALAVGSSAPPENVHQVMERLGAGALFGAVVHGMDVTRGKPDPQVFLVAARRLGIPPGRCAVVEDAPLGIQAAQAAGMTSVGLASTGRTRGQLSAADLVIDSLDELGPEVFRRLIGRGKAAQH
jgi:beta-phosphoglucomutase